MNKQSQMLFTVLLLMFIGGCTNYVGLNNTTFHTPTFKPGGTIYVAAAK